METVETKLPVLYFGTPVALLTTANPDGTSNISPISSAWALGDRYVLGLGTGGQAFANLQRIPELVIILPSAELVDAVEKIAPTTGQWPVPADMTPHYRYEVIISPSIPPDISPRCEICGEDIPGKAGQARTFDR